VWEGKSEAVGKRGPERKKGRSAGGASEKEKKKK